MNKKNKKEGKKKEKKKNKIKGKKKKKKKKRKKKTSHLVHNSFWGGLNWGSSRKKRRWGGEDGVGVGEGGKKEG